jgi:transcriptional regulator with XRE-family HTH domain
MTPPDEQSLGTRLRTCRVALGYTQTQFATVLRMSPAQVQRLEHDIITYAIPRALQRRLAALLQCSVKALGATPRPRPQGSAEAAPATLGARLRARRLGLRLTQQALAVRLATSASVICRWERNQGRPSPATLTRLARALRCRVGDLTAPCSPVPVVGD